MTQPEHVSIECDASYECDLRYGGDVGTFNQLFPLGHAYLGIMDFVGRQNVEAVSLGVVLTPWKRGRVSVQGHGFWRARVEDALGCERLQLARPPHRGG